MSDNAVICYLLMMENVRKNIVLSNTLLILLISKTVFIVQSSWQPLREFIWWK